MRAMPVTATDHQRERARSRALFCLSLRCCSSCSELAIASRYQIFASEFLLCIRCSYSWLANARYAPRLFAVTKLVVRPVFDLLYFSSRRGLHKDMKFSGGTSLWEAGIPFKLKDFRCCSWMSQRIVIGPFVLSLGRILRERELYVAEKVTLRGFFSALFFIHHDRARFTYVQANFILPLITR